MTIISEQPWKYVRVYCQYESRKEGVCHDTIPIEESMYCHDCRKSYCMNHVSKCFNCYQYRCNHDIRICNDCRQKVCRDHLLPYHMCLQCPLILPDYRHEYEYEYELDQKPETAITKTVATPMSIDELDDLIRMKKGNTVLKERRRGRKPKSEIE